MPYRDKKQQREAQRRHYLKNKEAYVERARVRRQRNRLLVKERRKECCICGMDEKACLDFHHLHDKTATISELIHEGTAAKLEAEFTKCQVICGNCHAKKHRPGAITDGSTWADKKRVEKRKWFLELSKTIYCTRCGEADYRCLEFHHIGQKRFGISYLLTSGHCLDFLKVEISRCIVLCVNCHRKEHITQA